MRSAVPRLAGALAVLFLAAGAAALGTAAPTEAAVAHAQITGSGSSWTANAINQWVADVQNKYQWPVVFTSTGSAQGRSDFKNKTTDFAVSDIGYQGQDPKSGQTDDSGGRAFAYLPVVAGGTAFPYHVEVNGKPIRNIRLGGDTLAKIFTNKITNWNDPAITADNNGRKLPDTPIKVVVHSEGSGSTAQFTTYLAKQQTAIWKAYYGSVDFTEYYPRKGSQIAQNGSDGVMSFIASDAGNGSIGYDEYSYALNAGFPVLKIKNKAGYFTAPDLYNVAVALTQAQINMKKTDPSCPTGPTNCYLLQDLSKVFTYGDKRTYPMSSYSYMIIPTAANDPRMTTAKRQTLVDYISYSICSGQIEMGPIGYSPLPINLVQASFSQVARLKAADKGVVLNNANVSKCNNPTFVAGHPEQNHLAKIAPMPHSCDKVGAGPCSGDEGVNTGNPDSNGKAPESKGSTTSSGGGGTGTGTGAGTGTGTGAGAPTGAAAVGGAIDPVTGQVIGGTTATGTDVTASETVLAAGTSPGTTTAFALFAALALVAIVVVPPFLYRRLSRNGGGPA